MAQQKRFLDVWIVESNTVYREVPYTVVSDWIQQSRLLSDDMVRRSGTKDWFKVGASPELSAYIPRSDPLAVEDEAEALEPIEMGFNWKRSRGEEEDDPDMIPLIDVSLVLLIFFMMTTVGSFSDSVVQNTPLIYNGVVVDRNDLLQIEIQSTDDGPKYYFGVQKKSEEGKDEGNFRPFPQLNPTLEFKPFMQEVRGALNDMKIKSGAERPLVILASEDLPEGHFLETLSELNSFIETKQIKPLDGGREKEKP